MTTVDTTAVTIAEDREPAPVTLFGTSNPAAVVAKATEQAKVLANVVRQQHLAVKLGGNREHVQFEGWTLLGSMLGVFPVTEWSRPLEDGSGWEARVEARTRAGETVGAAEAMCTRNERNWASRDDYALRSMAITRASAKALRMPLGFIMTLAGFDPTPREEMPEHHDSPARTPPQVTRKGAQSTDPEHVKAAMPKFSRVKGKVTGIVPSKMPSAFMTVQRESGRPINVLYRDTVSPDLWDQIEVGMEIECTVNAQPDGDAFAIAQIVWVPAVQQNAGAQPEMGLGE